MTLGERIKKARKTCGLTQREFAEKIGTTQNTIANYEIGHRNPSAAALNNICKTFNVSEKWLRTGEGEMLVPTPETTIDKLVEEFHLDELDREIITAYLNLPEADRIVVKRYVQNLSQRIQKASAAEPVTIEQEARAEAERYYQELVREKKQASQAPFVKESDAG